VENQVHAELGQPAMFQRLESVAAVFLAVWSWAKLQLDLFQHPSLIRHTFRLPEESVPAKLWRRLRGEDPSGHNVQVELRPEQTIWVRIEGRLAMAGADRLGQDLKNALARRRERLVLDLNHLKASEHEALELLGRTLAQYKHRIRVVLPADRDFSAFAALNALQIQCVFSMATTPS
jgi:hypothetical protein